MNANPATQRSLLEGPKKGHSNGANRADAAGLHLCLVPHQSVWLPLLGCRCFYWFALVRFGFACRAVNVVGAGLLVGLLALVQRRDCRIGAGAKMKETETETERATSNMQQVGWR